MLVFNTTGAYASKGDKGEPIEIKTLDRNYRQEDCKTKRAYTIDEYPDRNLSLGGNVHMVYELQDSPIVLLVNTSVGFKVYATAIRQEDAYGYLTSLPASVVRNLTYLYGMKFPQTATKVTMTKEFLEKVYGIKTEQV